MKDLSIIMVMRTEIEISYQNKIKMNFHIIIHLTNLNRQFRQITLLEVEITKYTVKLSMNDEVMKNCEIVFFR